MTQASPALTITRWHPDRAPELAKAFHDINAAWIEAMFTLEDGDRKTLLNPQGAIIDKGGDILFVEVDGLGIVGACALMPHSDGAVELTKMGVLDTARGKKAGEALLAAVLKRAEEMGIMTLFLLTNHICEAAIHLYEKAGFVHDADIMERYGCGYERCDVAMRYTG
jgi:N-acetylglutamate synthase-like GNAT family acetyltransferase